jgi:hypothetical protein
MSQILLDFADSLATLLPAVLAGAGVGFLSGVFGIGGGFLIVPVLNLVLRIDMEIAVGTGACQVLGPATTSLLARRVQLRHLRLPLTIAGGLLVGVFSGAHLLESAKQQGAVVLWGRSINAVDLIVLPSYFVLLLAIGGFAFWESGREQTGRKIGRGWIAGWRIPPFGEFDEFDRPQVSIVTISCFGLGVGFVSGLLGMSGGLILIPGLIYLLGMKTHKAVLSSLIIVWIVAFQSTIAHAWHGNVDLPLVVALLLGGTAGARFGSEIGGKLHGRRFRQRFSWLLLTAAVLIGASLIRLFLAAQFS